MGPVRRSLALVVLPALALAAPGQAQPPPADAPYDYVLVSGIVTSDTGPPVVLDVTATAGDAAGGPAQGTFRRETLDGGPASVVSGAVTCLTVAGPVATLAGPVDPATASPGLDAFALTVRDGDGDGAPDAVGAGTLFPAAELAARCRDHDPVLQPLASGDVLVRDAPLPFATPTRKGDCRRGGWREVRDDAGRPFRNQGRCVSFVVRR